MFCKNCGKEIPEESKFCPSCGEQISNIAENKQEEQKEQDSVSYNVSKDTPEKTEVISVSTKIENGRKKINVATVFLIILAILGFSYFVFKNKNSNTSNGTSYSSSNIPANWISYSPPDNTFTASFPGTPEFASSNLEGNNFTAVMNQYNYTNEVGIPYYSVTVGLYDLKSVELTQTQANSMLEAAVDAMIKETNCSLVHSNFEKKGDYYIVDFLGKGNLAGTNFYMRGRGMIKETSKMFIALLISTDENPKYKDQFINSLQPK